MTTFNVGDKVKITRAAKTRENGWYNSWVHDMDKAVGKIGTVERRDYYGVQVNIPGVNGTYYYPEFVLEQVGFKIGDRVRVRETRGGPFKLIPATVVSGAHKIAGHDGHDIRLDTGRTVYFFVENLEFLPVAATLTRTPSKASTLGSAYVAGTEAARRLAKQNGRVTADEVQAELAKIGYTSRDLGNAAGAIFRSGSFRKVGQVNSTRPGNRGRKISQWELVGA